MKTHGRCNTATWTVEGSECAFVIEADEKGRFGDGKVVCEGCGRVRARGNITVATLELRKAKKTQQMCYPREVVGDGWDATITWDGEIRREVISLRIDGVAAMKSYPLQIRDSPWYAVRDVAIWAKAALWVMERKSPSEVAAFQQYAARKQIEDQDPPDNVYAFKPKTLDP